MKALSLDGPKQFRYVEIPEPASPGATKSWCRFIASEYAEPITVGIWENALFQLPSHPGHELGVQVLAVGEGVQNVAVGDRCAVEPYINCQRCYSCKRGLTNCCEQHKTLGVMCDGGMTERILLPARKVHPSSKLRFEQLALVETLAIGCHAIDRAKPTPQEHVLIIGAGPIGLSAVEFARLSGASTIVMDLSPDRLKFTRERMKVEHTIQLDPARPEAALATLQEITGNQLADVVIDATGSHQSMSQAMQYCSFGGRLVYVGITQAELNFAHAPIMHRRELTLMASRNALTGDFSKIIRLIEEGQIDTVPWITHQAAFESVVSIFPDWLDPNSRVIKAIVQMTA